MKKTVHLSAGADIRRRWVMAKKIAVLVRDRQAEALRMAVGLTLKNDEVSVFVMDAGLEDSSSAALSIEMLKELRVKMYSNMPQNALELLSREDIAQALLDYDAVIPY